tara:strand:- start:1587 stop:1760 length:174 start_codon:yes stop_codon:yes gene_type:complete
MSEFLKGNFEVKNKVVEKKEDSENESLKDRLKKDALNSIGGSMVYVERTDLTWDGEE